MSTTEAVRVTIPTAIRTVEAHAFEQPSGFVYVALVIGDLGDGSDVIVRVHSNASPVMRSARCAATAGSSCARACAC